MDVSPSKGGLKMKRPKAFSLLELILFISIIGLFSYAAGQKGYSYLRMFTASQAEKEYHFALDVFKKYARIESKTVVVSVVEMNDSTTVLAPKIDSNLHNKKFKIPSIKIKKRVDANKILFFSDGAVEFVH
ncbi:MAG: type II secretion system protein [Chlamydiae bacterium]|nr:type II secretion system protein [Chlamydiota bacterium]